MSSPLDAWERRTAPILTALAAAALVTLVLEAAFDAHTRAATVGYGDRYPVTPEGRVVGGVLMVVGIATMGAVTAAIASQLINPRQSASRSQPTNVSTNSKHRSPTSLRNSTQRGATSPRSRTNPVATRG
jgi:Ion channel